MVYRQFIPSFPLSEFINSMYFLKGNMDQSEKNILPDYKTDLIFLFDSKMTGYTDPGRQITVSTSIINGFRREPLHFSYQGNTEMLGIRFHPFGFTQLFRVQPKELTDFPRVSDILESGKYGEIMEKISLEPEPAKKIRIIENWLLNIVRRAKIQTSLAIRAVHKISATKGILPLRVICNNSPSEYKQLQRFCHDVMDISPKSYTRMVRFEHIHQYIIENQRPDWMELVANLEFTDQSHLIREIKDFTGLTPKEFLSQVDSFI
jgi:AraC-like DNA-binding protein